MGTPSRRKTFTIPERLLEARRAGEVTLHAMAQACGVSSKTIWEELRRLGIRVQMPRGRKPAVERRRQAAALRAQGLTLKEIGQRLGVTYQKVSYLLKPLKSKS